MLARARVVQAAASVSVRVTEMVVDVAVLMDSGPGSDLAAQQQFVLGLAGALHMRLDGRVARVAVLRYGDTATVQQTLTGDEGLVSAAATAVAGSGSDASRGLEAGLDAARAELASRGRLTARRLVVALGLNGAFGGDFAAAATRLSVDGVTVAVVTVDAAGAGISAADTHRRRRCRRGGLQCRRNC